MIASYLKYLKIVKVNRDIVFHVRGPKKVSSDGRSSEGEQIEIRMSQSDFAKIQDEINENFKLDLYQPNE